MDFSDAGVLISGLVLGLIGMAMFVYGKKAENFRCLCVGLVMTVFPIFVHSLLVMWLLAGACMAVLYLVPRG